MNTPHQYQQAEPGAPARNLSAGAVVGIFLAVLVIWLLTPFIISAIYPQISDRGLAGDLFGSVNALFSGLAFAGVIVAILLQREELELQRHEITANRVELSRAATAQEESREALRKTVYAQAFKTAMDVLQAPEVRQARGVVLYELKNKPLHEWTHQQVRAAEVVCHTYDSVAIMVRHEMIPVAYIADS